MSKLNVILKPFDTSEVANTASSKAQIVCGESFIIDWSLPGFQHYKSQFEDLSAIFSNLYGKNFVPQKHHHSTILSKRLDPHVDLQANQGGWWRDPSLAETRACWDSHCSSLFLRLDALVVAPGGTIQIVLRDNISMPRIRNRLVDLGASVKADTIKGDRINTCTVVLGYFKQAPAQVPADDLITDTWNNWANTFPSEVLVHSMSLVRYFDLSLDQYITLQRF